MRLKTPTEMMAFLWITIVPGIIVWISDSEAKDRESVKSDSELFCPMGWNSFGMFCYKGFSERRNAEDAQKECVKFGGYLASITSKELQDFLTANVLLSVGYRSYIGLRHNESSGQSYWMDGSELEFTAWDANEPSRKDPLGTVENCVEMAFDDVLQKLGKWNDIWCNQPISYICQKPKDPETEKPASEPGQCSWSLDGIYFRNSCFHFSSHRKTWHDAEKYCAEQYNGHLASVTDAAVQKFLHYEVENHHAQTSRLWIGLKLKPGEISLWSSGWYVGYNNWRDREPHEKDSSEYCAAMTTTGRGEWILSSCDYHMEFICENSTVVPPAKLTPSVPRLKCPSEEWTDLGGDYCYMFNKKTYVSWYQGNFLCMRKGGTLLTIHSKQEEQAIIQFVRNIQTGIHLGLFRHDRSEETSGEFEWVDHSPLNYVNWRYGEPNSKEEICVEAIPREDLIWNDLKCDSALMVVCSVEKNVSLKSANGRQSDLQLKACECLPPPAIAGVALCVLLVIVLLGVVLYNMKPWRKNSEQQNKRKRKMSGTSGKHLYRNRQMVVSEQIYENVDRAT